MSARHTRQTGFSLVELMVALVLGLILTSGVISVYITSKNTYNLNNALGAVQEHGRFAFSFMDPDVRMAGYTGCSYVKGGNSNLSNTYYQDPVYSFTSAIYGYEANGTGVGGSLDLNANPSYLTTPPVSGALWTPALTNNGNTLYNAVKATALRGSDIFMVHYMKSFSPALLAPTYDDGTKLYVSTTDHDANGNAVNDTSYFSVGTVAIVNNCTSTFMNIFQVTAIDATAGTLSHDTGGTLGNLGPQWSSPMPVTVPVTPRAYNPTGGNYGTTGGSVGPAVVDAYYIGKGVDGGPALFEASLLSDGSFSAQELVSGIENMQVLYGVDTDGDQIPNQFQTADTVDAANNWASVVSVRVALLARSDDNSTDQTAPSAPSYFMLATDTLGNANADGMTLTAPKDRRLRRYFVQTFSVRNALP